MIDFGSGLTLQYVSFTYETEELSLFSRINLKQIINAMTSGNELI